MGDAKATSNGKSEFQKQADMQLAIGTYNYTWWGLLKETALFKEIREHIN